MRTLLLVFLISVSGFAQRKDKLEIRIDSVSTENTDNTRNFTLHYHIRNLTSEAVSFFLETAQILPNASSSQSNKPFYRLYQEKNMLDIWGIFEPWNRPDNREYITMIDTVNTIGRTREEFLEVRKKEIRNSRLRLEPNGTLDLTHILRWDKERYFQHDDLEYYLDEKLPHSIEIGVNLLREEFKDTFTEAEFEELMSDQTLIRGWYMSNRVPIDFGP